MTQNQRFLKNLRSLVNYHDYGTSIGTHDLFFLEYDVEKRNIGTEWLESIGMWGVGITSFDLDSDLPDIFLVVAESDNLENEFFPTFENPNQDACGIYMTEYWNPVLFPSKILDLLRSCSSRKHYSSRPAELPDNFYPITRITLSLQFLKHFLAEFQSSLLKYHNLQVHQLPPDKHGKGYIDEIETSFKSFVPAAYNSLFQKIADIARK